MNKSTYRVEFLPQKAAGYFPEGTPLRDAALTLGIVVESTCAGLGNCAKCKVIAGEGVSPLTPAEIKHLTPEEIEKGVRLSCQANLVADCTCTVPPGSHALGERVLTEDNVGTTALSPDLKKFFLTIPEHKLGEKFFEFEAVLEALREQGQHIAGYPHSAVASVPGLLNPASRDLTAVIDHDRLITLEPGDTTNRLFGVAIDIGTTTLAARLVNLQNGEILAMASALNPQRAHGADIISRIHYLVEHPDGLQRLHRMVIHEINRLIETMTGEAGIRLQEIYKVVLVGNTVMHHLALNINPRHIAYKPYTPVLQGPTRFAAAQLEIAIHPEGSVYFPPNLACFVGSDLTAVLTVLDLLETTEPALVVDLGTNGEVVLGNREKILCTSAPAGPAWEGASIEWGMPAARGAIERAAVNNGELRILTIGQEKPLGLCGSGLIDLVCEFRRIGLIDPSGRILGPDEAPATVPEALRRRILVRDSGAHDVAVARTDDGKWITLTQKDVREVQLAKAAVKTGIDMLMQEYGLSASDISRVYISGGFGNHVRARDLHRLGLISRDIREKQLLFIGNAALAGAEAILRSRTMREKAEHLARMIQFVEIADRPDFQDVFVNAMTFPEFG